MIFEKLMSSAQRYNVSLEALAVLGTKLRADSEQLTIAPSLAPLIDRVVEALGFSPAELAALPDQQRRAVAAMIRSFLRQAAEMLEQPEQAPGWSYHDAVILQSQGRA